MKTVRDVMTHAVVTVGVDEVVGPLRDLMLDRGLHGVPVLGPDGGLRGIVTSTDLVEEWAPEQGVQTVMSDRVATVGPDATVEAAASLMRERHIHHLVVTEGTDVVGIVSTYDLIEALVRTVSELGAAYQRLSARPGDHIRIMGQHLGDKERRGLIAEVLGEDGGPPYRVQWLDDPHDPPHAVLFFPGPDAHVEMTEGG